MSAEIRAPEKALADLLADHTRICGVPLRGLAAGEHAGERVYAVRCPKCAQVVAHLIIADRLPRP